MALKAEMQKEGRVKTRTSLDRRLNYQWKIVIVFHGMRRSWLRKFRKYKFYDASKKKLTD